MLRLALGKAAYTKKDYFSGIDVQLTQVTVIRGQALIQWYIFKIDIPFCGI
jgi:hypothetical protein